MAKRIVVIDGHPDASNERFEAMTAKKRSAWLERIQQLGRNGT